VTVVRKKTLSNVATVNTELVVITASITAFLKKEFKAAIFFLQNLLGCFGRPKTLHDH
jgi:hypothetical protein